MKKTLLIILLLTVVLMLLNGGSVLARHDTCYRCHGSRSCQDCYGRGRIDRYGYTRRCPYCHGSGHCPSCHGHSEHHWRSRRVPVYTEASPEAVNSVLSALHEVKTNDGQVLTISLINPVVEVYGLVDSPLSRQYHNDVYNRAKYVYDQGLIAYYGLRGSNVDKKNGSALLAKARSLLRRDFQPDSVKTILSFCDAYKVQVQRLLAIKMENLRQQQLDAEYNARFQESWRVY